MRSLVLYSDASIVVADKPAGMYVHPSPCHEKGTLTEALLEEFPDMHGVGSRERPGVVHRLDSGTSGVVVFARTQKAYVKLRKMFESHETVEKTYLAVHRGTFKPAAGSVELMIGRKPWDPRRMAVVEIGGNKAVSSWEVLSKTGGFSIVEWKIRTGRTHQIRVTAAHLGFPVAGDTLYGGGKETAKRLPAGRHLLHAVALSFPHPDSGKRVEFLSRPPDEILFPQKYF